MIDCYTWITDNGYKPRMMLEETGLPHKIIPVDLRKKAQMEPDFMKLSPGHKIPAIVDHDGPGGAQVTICESGGSWRSERWEVSIQSRLRLLDDLFGRFHVAVAFIPRNVRNAASSSAVS
jgi:hypothetical protein